MNWEQVKDRPLGYPWRTDELAECFAAVMGGVAHPGRRGARAARVARIPAGRTGRPQRKSVRELGPVQPGREKVSARPGVIQEQADFWMMWG